ncbi:PLP-dependent transferase [Sarocladium strictum]
MTIESDRSSGLNGLAKANGAASEALNGSLHQNGNATPTTLHRAEETDDLLMAVRDLIIPFIKSADDAAAQKHTGQTYRTASGKEHNTLVDFQKPAEMIEKLKLSMPGEGQGKEGLLETIDKVLKYSVNTWDQGFLDKLFASNTPVGVISDLVLSVLNTNLHVYQVAPALTIVEKVTAKALANLFGFNGDHAGGINCQGGSSSNLTSLVTARNTLYPDCREGGNAGHDFAIFTSAHGHYSVEKAAMICGMGITAVWPVAVDDEGRMRTDKLRERVIKAKEAGKTPLYVNATAGTTVRGSFEPFEEVSAICKEFNMWMHIDASWGGPVIFSAQQRHKMRGSHLADSLTINPHKMLNVPATCSYLLGPDTRIFNAANRTKAGYLFHSSEDGEVWDMADLTLQCGRRADSLKLALAWVYYGSQGFERQIDHGFEMANYLYDLIAEHPDLQLASPVRPGCYQVCFYYAPGGQLSEDNEVNTARTAAIVEKMITRGFMCDYAPGPRGHFFRCVVNCQTLKGTVDGLVKAAVEVGHELY